MNIIPFEEWLKLNTPRNRAYSVEDLRVGYEAATKIWRDKMNNLIAGDAEEHELMFNRWLYEYQMTHNCVVSSRGTRAAYDEGLKQGRYESSLPADVTFECQTGPMVDDPWIALPYGTTMRVAKSLASVPGVTVRATYHSRVVSDEKIPAERN